MKTDKYLHLINTLKNQGVDFSRDVWTLSQSELSEFADIAKKYGYKKPVLHSRGFGFYMLLQKISNKTTK